MARALNAPKDPEFLVGTIAAMRLLSGQRQPQDPLEREMLAHLQALQLKPEVAKRIVAAFEAKPRRDRRRLLGSYADKSHALESLVSAAPPHSVVRDHRSDTSSGGRAGSGSGSRTWPGSGNVGPLAEEVSTGAEPGIRYSVRYKGLWCQEETTGLGSDEIYVVTSGLAINKGVNTAVAALTHPISTQSKYYGDVDSREERVGRWLSSIPATPTGFLWPWS